MTMAYTGFGDTFDAPHAEAGGSFRRWIAGLFAWRSAQTPETAAPLPEPSRRKLAGPDPRDARARGYMADLDMEMGF